MVSTCKYISKCARLSWVHYETDLSEQYESEKNASIEKCASKSEDKGIYCFVVNLEESLFRPTTMYSSYSEHVSCSAIVEL